jgi:hypothetical protein
MKNAKKGQAALEYLMTYGWAILVIVIVLGILLLLFTNMTKIQRCQTPVGFSCGDSQPMVKADASGQLTLSMVLQNGLGKSIKVWRALCYVGSEPTALTSTGTLARRTSAIQISPGGIGTFTGSTTIPCYYSATPDTRAIGSANQQFNGVVVYEYTEVPDSIATYPAAGGDVRKMSVSVSTTIVQG